MKSTASEPGLTGPEIKRNFLGIAWHRCSYVSVGTLEWYQWWRKIFSLNKKMCLLTTLCKLNNFAMDKIDQTLITTENAISSRDSCTVSPHPSRSKIVFTFVCLIWIIIQSSRPYKNTKICIVVIFLIASLLPSHLYLL